MSCSHLSRRCGYRAKPLKLYYIQCFKKLNVCPNNLPNLIMGIEVCFDIGIFQRKARSHQRCKDSTLFLDFQIFDTLFLIATNMAKQDMRQKLVYVAYRKLRGHPINLNVPGNVDNISGNSYCVGYGRANDVLLFKVERRYGGWQHTKEEMNHNYFMENSILEPQFLYWNVSFRMPVVKELLKQIKYKDET